MCLFGIMVCTICIRIAEDESIKNMSNSFVSMYNDRLIPATDLFFLAENIYGKRFILEDILSKPGAEAADFKLVEGKLLAHNNKIDSLVSKYERTLLIKQEKNYLIDLKTKLHDARQVEGNILLMSSQHSLEDGRKMFETFGKSSFSTTIQKLSELTRIQTEVGQELLTDSTQMVSGSQIYSAVQIVLAIFIGILIVGIVFTSNSVKIQNNNFNLN